jgi:hypothetical protein
MKQAFVSSVIIAEETEQNHDSPTPRNQIVTVTTVAPHTITTIKRVASIQKGDAQTPRRVLTIWTLI